MDRSNIKGLLPAQRRSDTSGFGAGGVMVPDPLASSSSVGPCFEPAIGFSLNSTYAETNHGVVPWSPIVSGNRLRVPQVENTTRDNSLQEFQEDSPSCIRERALDILSTIGSDKRIKYNYELYSAIFMVMDCVDGLFSAADKMRRCRDYLLAKNKDQYLLIHANEVSSSNLIMLEHKPVDRGLTEEIFAGELMTLNSPPRLSSINCSFGSPSVLRGDDIDQLKANLNRFGTSLIIPSRSNSRPVRELADRIEEVQGNIDRINQEIAIKSASLKLLDTASGTVLEKLVSEVNLETEQRVGRARRRGEASRPRGGPPRIRSPNGNENMDTNKINEEMLPPQGIRTPSGRRESPTVPGALLSSSNEGPAPLSPTGGGRELATVEAESDPRDPLDLTFVDCPSMIEEEPQALSQAPLLTPLLTLPQKGAQKKKRGRGDLDAEEY
ncbi:hypothetical protein RF55_10598 [Lasius niger]|uniref:Uncharacterized protein n=1 Tax=Lasius niger TaxID=67767 RepID=A0A0J7KHL5_LASNI|nr:hypothetical protein RF55_10598 [Lasius niger]